MFDPLGNNSYLVFFTFFLFSLFSFFSRLFEFVLHILIQAFCTMYENMEAKQEILQKHWYADVMGYQTVLVMQISLNGEQ